MKTLRALCVAVAFAGCGDFNEIEPLLRNPSLQGVTPRAQIQDCDVSPASFVGYETEAELQQLLVGRWQRCKPPQVAGEDVGVEFTAEHRWYPLTRDSSGAVVRRTGVDYGGEWKYLPPGEPDLISNEPNPRGQFVLTAITNPPQFTDNPRQLRVLFSPVQGIYIPLR